MAFLNSLWLFASTFGVATAILAAFVFIYERFTPYREFKYIFEQNSVPVALLLSGALLGVAIPLVSCIYYTQGYLELAAWATVTTGIQLALHLLLRKRVMRALEGNLTAPALLIATLSVVCGMLSAVCISH